MIMAEYTRAYPSVTESEEKMLDDVLRILEEHSVPDELLNRFVLAVSEAFTNALVHGNGRRSDKTIVLKLQINGDALVADIIDQGQGGLERIKRRQPPSMLSENGRGVDLMEYYASELKFAETDSGGLQVSLRFDRIRKRQNISHT